MFKEDSSKPSRQKLCLMRIIIIIIIIVTWVTWVIDALCVWFALGWCTKRTPAKTVIKEIIIIIIIVDQGLVLNKHKFRDSLRLRYNMPPSDLPSKCVCGEKYTVCHALSCKKGGFVAQRQGGVRNLLTSLIGKVCTKKKNYRVTSILTATIWGKYLSCLTLSLSNRMLKLSSTR